MIGPRLHVALVGCGSAKLAAPAAARNLYTGPLFRAQLAYAESIAPRVYVVSALHGVVHPDEVLRPYDHALQGLPRPLLEEWGRKVLLGLEDELRALPGKVTILAGNAYAWPILRAIEMHNAHAEHVSSKPPRWSHPAELVPQRWPAPVVPLEGLGIGERLRWFRMRRVAA